MICHTFVLYQSWLTCIGTIAPNYGNCAGQLHILRNISDASMYRCIYALQEIKKLYLIKKITESQYYLLWFLSNLKNFWILPNILK